MIKRDGEGGALPELTFDFNGTAHHRDKLFHDRHAKPCTGDLSHRSIAFTGESVVNSRKILFAHADACIRDDCLDPCKAFPLARKFSDSH